MQEYYYYIFVNGVDSKTLKKNEIPQIRKLSKDSAMSPTFLRGREGEGPFNSIRDLKKKSLIFREIKLSKHRQKVLEPNNIVEIESFTLIPFEKSYELTFIKAFHHVNVGKIHKKEVKGVHFFNPDRIKILEMLDKNEGTGVYCARISTYDSNSDQWFEKNELTHFFPDDWTLEKLFSELNYAYENKIHQDGNIYLSETRDHIKVKLIIKESEILTIYPLLN